MDASIAPAEGREVLRDFRNECRAQNKVLEECRSLRAVGICKKGAQGGAANYWPISLPQTGYTIYARIRATRQSQGLDMYTRSSQRGSRQGRSTAEPMFIIRRIRGVVRAKRIQALRSNLLGAAKSFGKAEPQHA